MANYQFTQDLIDDVLFRAGENTAGNSQYQAQVLTYLNRAYQTLYSGAGELDPGVQENWLWARAATPGYLVLYPELTTQAGFTQNNASGTFSPAPSLSWAGGFCQVVNAVPPTSPVPYGLYRITAHTAGQAAFTLGQVFLRTTGSYSVRVFKAEYDLAADCLRPIPPLRLYKPALDVGDPPGGVYECDQMDIAALNALYPLSRLEAVAPRYYAQIGETKIRLSGTVSTDVDHLVQVEYDYIQKPADLTNAPSEEPILPGRYRKILADLALFYVYIDKADIRGQGFLELAKQSHLAMALENRNKISFFDPSHMPQMMAPVQAPQGG